ncbi:M4 family metallopeptidase [Dyadobacter tibetensis]|uniref:M4 family metallopeptidase n=1 Tax=Dyadobacter tibetensis TaxID=1211851 RepID=UPI00046F5B65|nr:M4 family metallopeptidase [Dyadobacter tibetensis]
MTNRLLLSFITVFLISHAVEAQNAVDHSVAAFSKQYGASATIHPATNSVSFIRFADAYDIGGKGATVSSIARDFMSMHGQIFGARPLVDEFTVTSQVKDSHGQAHLTLQQSYQSVPVYDGILKYHYNDQGKLVAINGNFIKDIKVKTKPSISSEKAAALAVRHLLTGQLRTPDHPTQVKSNKLYIFQKGLAQGYNGPKHLVYEIELANDWDVREFLYIDAHEGSLVEQFSGMHGIERKLYEGNTSSGNLKYSEGNVFPGSLSKWQQSQVETAGHVFNLFKNSFGFESFDNRNTVMISVDKSSSIKCPNATWNGSHVNFCEGTAADDAVAHEWGHAYTQYTSGLIYSWQSGAINESFSDIWGETIDQINGYFDENESNAARTACGSSSKWMIGEQMTAFGSGGAIRDMWNPNCKSAPGKVSDTQYYCGSGDNGGVHINSGVPNHAYALLVDGGTFNGQTIRGIGLTKAAHVFWRAQSEYMTATTDFLALADILESAMTDLIGMNLEGLSTRSTPAGASNEIISKEDVYELKKVIEAVELRRATNCNNFSALLKPVTEDCSGAQAEEAFFFESFEAGMGGWTVSNESTSSTWSNSNWQLNSNPPGRHSGTTMYGTNRLGGNCSSMMQNGVMRLTSPSITIPSNAFGPFMLAFDHYVAIETGYDGGNLMYKIDQGPWIMVPDTAFTDNPYNRTLLSTLYGNNNPKQGQAAFSGTDEGTLSGSWGQSRVNLTRLGINAGATVQLRWEMGSDGCNGYDGWYIDNVSIYSCAMPTVQFIEQRSVVNEAVEPAIGGISGADDCLPYTDRKIALRINKAPSSPVTVTFNPLIINTQTVEAQDYSITPNTFEFSSERLVQDVFIRVYDNAYIEGDRTLELSYVLSNTAGGDALPATNNQKYLLTILEDDRAPGETEVTLLQSDFEGEDLSDWNISTHNNQDNLWRVLPFPEVWLDNEGKKFMYISSDKTGNADTHSSVESRLFNGHKLTNIQLSFLEYFKSYSGASDFDEQAYVELWDGQNWQILLTHNEQTGDAGSWDQPYQRNIPIPSKLAHDKMKIRFRYHGNYDYWWAIDNIKITGDHLPAIQEEVSFQADQQYLGPNKTVYFHDPNTGNLLAKIQNLTDHDYGCTSVEVDRSGANETSWFDHNKITKKTLHVIPANPNPNGRYEITLYYTQAELSTFNGNQITGMGKTEGGISQANAGNSLWKETQANPGVNGGWAYTSIFDSGLSGFGLTNATPSGPLPVTLIKFAGQHREEGNLLEWSTSEELNHAYFELERSNNGQQFKSIAIIAPQADRPDELRRYAYWDTRPLPGQSYYRLRMVDKDGSHAFSRIVAVEAKSYFSATFYPNPLQQYLTVELPDQMDGARLEIFDSQGQRIFEKNNLSSSQKQTWDLSTTLRPGLHILQITSGNSVQNFKFIKN